MCDLPSSPVFCPHFGFIVTVWLEVFTVETIAGINLSHDQKIQILIRQRERDMSGSICKLKRIGQVVDNRNSNYLQKSPPNTGRSKSF